MGSRFISALALYGPKAEPLRGFLASVQALIAGQLGASFRPYTLDQVHATLIALNGVPDPATGSIVNEYYLEHAGAGLEMDLSQVMRILAAHFARPLRVRIGSHWPGQDDPFLSRGQRLFERSFSVQDAAFVLIGWPIAALTGPGRPLDELRRAMNAAHVLHRYHRRDTDVDDDLYLVVGHHAGAAPDALVHVAAAVRGRLAADPVEFDIGIGDIKVVAADSPAMAPPLFVGDIPADESALRALMTTAT